MPVNAPLFSVLDLAPIPQGSSPAQSFANTISLAQHTEKLGYYRYWLAEHHNIPGIASAATSILISHVASHTTRIRVGAGGIMLPNHSPLTIAEQFGTLETLYPNRIDLALGRAPGGDPLTARALRRENKQDSFPDDVIELQSYFRPANPPPHVGSASADASSIRHSAIDIRHSPTQHSVLSTQHSPSVRAIPGHDLHVPLFILGSSTFGATLAARLGLPFAFASHFAPDYLLPALEIYRKNFRPSPQLPHPHTIVGINLFLADTDAEARRLFTTLQQAFLNLIRGHPTELPPPTDSMDTLWSPHEQAHVTHMTHYSLVGSPTTARAQLAHLLEQTGADELIATAQIYDHQARLRSFELAATVFADLTPHPHPFHHPFQASTHYNQVMTPPPDLLNQILALPAEKQREIVLQVIHNLDGSDVPDDRDEAQQLWAEIEARLDRADADTGSDLDWRAALDDVRTQLRRKGA